jgi:pilus assembly protein Flp/PilA
MVCGSAFAIDMLPWPRSQANPPAERTEMNHMLLKLYCKFQDLMNREEGQDLVEYALIIALIAFGCTAGMAALSGGINQAFTSISSALVTYV